MRRQPRWRRQGGDRNQRAGRRTARPRSHVQSSRFGAAADTDEVAEGWSAATVKKAQANVETTRINLGYTNVTSPITGIAGEQQVTEDALVGQGTPTLLTTGDQPDPIYVNFDEPAAQLEELASEEQAGHLVAAGNADAKVQLAARR